MKNLKCLSFLLMLTLPLAVAGQKKNVETSVLSGSQLAIDADLDWSFHLQNYTDSTGSRISRSSLLNDHANARASYYANILDLNSLHKRLNESMRQIPDGSESHTKSFGNPDYFSKNGDVNYVHLYTIIEKGGLKREVKSEIMQECFYALKTDSPLDNNELIVRAINAHKRKKGDDFILHKYLSSPSHRKSIENTENKNFGTSSVYIIHKWYDELESRWINEIVLLNVTIFS